MERNPERVKETRADWCARYGDIRLKENSQKYKQENRARCTAQENERRAQMLKALPKWADISAIEVFYELSYLFTIYFDVQFNVDHIVPLQSDFVCGLHCEANLRVITAEENISKNNRYWPDMP